MRFLQAAVKQIAERRQNIIDQSFRPQSYEPGWQEKHVQDVGRVTGLQEAIEIILNITKADDPD